MSGQKIIDGLKDAVAYVRGDKSRGRETVLDVKKNDWIYIHEFYGSSDYVEELVRYPDNTRMVDIGVMNGNVSHSMTGFYYKDEWYSDDWMPGWGTHFRKLKVTPIAWRELKMDNAKP